VSETTYFFDVVYFPSSDATQKRCIDTIHVKASSKAKARRFAMAEYRNRGYTLGLTDGYALGPAYTEDEV